MVLQIFQLVSITLLQLYHFLPINNANINIATKGILKYFQKMWVPKD